MKYSKAMLKGYETNEGRQCAHVLRDDSGAMCVHGAINMGQHGHAEYNYGDEVERDKRLAFMEKFEEVWGDRPHTLNNAGLDWMDIYGMARAAGL